MWSSASRRHDYLQAVPGIRRLSTSPAGDDGRRRSSGTQPSQPPCARMSGSTRRKHMVPAQAARLAPFSDENMRSKSPESKSCSSSHSSTTFKSVSSRY